MLDLQYICDHVDEVADNCRNRGVAVDLAAFLELRNRRGELISHVDTLRREQNELSAQIPKEKDAQKKQELIARGKELRQSVTQKEADLKDTEAALRNEQAKIPNMTHPAAPVGRLADDNKVVRTWGTKPSFGFKPLDHVALAEKHDLLDLEAGARVAGHGFYFLKNEAVLLEMALVQYAMQKLVAEGFTLHTT